MRNDEGDSLSDSDNIAGWPKMINEEPDFRPHSPGSDQSDETDYPHDINMKMKGIFADGENIYGALTAFIQFHELGLYPPKWVLDHLAAKFRRHCADPNPYLFAFQLGISGRGSGSTNPYQRFVWWLTRYKALEDMLILVGSFDITLTDAARAIAAKRKLQIATKTLVNQFGETYGDTNKLTYKNIRWGWFLNEEERDKYLSGFPRHALKYIKDKNPQIKPCANIDPPSAPPGER